MILIGDVQCLPNKNTTQWNAAVCPCLSAISHSKPRENDSGTHIAQKHDELTWIWEAAINAYPTDIPRNETLPNATGDFPFQGGHHKTSSVQDPLLISSSHVQSYHKPLFSFLGATNMFMAQTRKANDQFSTQTCQTFSETSFPNDAAEREFLSWRGRRQGRGELSCLSATSWRLCSAERRLFFLYMAYITKHLGFRNC